MSERPPEDAALAKALAQLELDALPEPLHRALATTLDWVHRLDREAAAPGGGADVDATRPR
jgi:hypothetical protein